MRRGALNLSATPAEFLPGNRVELLETGGEYFPALRLAIAQAQREIFLETYIFEQDATGRAIAADLIAAARRGVAVRVLVDGFGASAFSRGLLLDMRREGVNVLVYRPEIARFSLRRHRLRRLHRKVSVMDGRIAFVGGINVLDDIDPRHADEGGAAPPRYDYAVRVEGPLLAPIHASTRRIWELVAWASLKRRLRVRALLPVAASPLGSVRAAFVIRDNLRHRHDIEDAYLEAIASAKEEIILANAYFLPGRRFRLALEQAAARGVKVVVLLQGRVEYLLQHLATQALFGSLLSRGIRIYEYHQSFLHAKVAVIDRQWATVGSSNIDPFSLLLAREANVVVRDEGFACQLRDSLHLAMERGAEELLSDDWRRKGLWSRFSSWLAYSLVRWMIGIAGYRGMH